MNTKEIFTAPVSFQAEPISSATLLERSKEKVIKMWLSRVRESFSNSEKQSIPALLDGLPVLIDEIINALSLVGFQSDDRKNISKEHGSQRATLAGYTLKQVMSEMRILREVIFAVMEEDGSSVLPPRDRDIILDSIEKGLVTAGSEFMKLRIEEKENLIHQSQDVIEKLESEQKFRDLFVSTLTHDLRTPLTAAKLNTQLVKRAYPQDQKIGNLVIRIDSGLTRIEDMINTLLDANEMRSGRSLTFQKKEYDLNSQINELVTEVTATCDRKFVVQCPTSPTFCFLAREKIGRAIENLLTNALKYGSANTPITVGIAQEKDEIKIWVHNEGRAIPKEEQLAIFDPFFRSSTVRMGNQKGWGLGLTLVKGILEAHGGRVELSSSPETGTTFSLFVPNIKHL
jgi:signal transduction histidine kinase